MGLFSYSSDRAKKYKRKADKYKNRYEDTSRDFKDYRKDVKQDQKQNDRYGSIQQNASKLAPGMAERGLREGDYAYGKSRADEILGRRYQGIDPTQRRNMEETANQGINRQIQGYQRQLTAQQGQRGVRGGAAYAQNADLARMGTEAQGQYQRDLSNLDSDLALKKLAAAYNIEQGEASQGNLDRQMSLDEKRFKQEKKRQEALTKQANRAFSRV